MKLNAPTPREESEILQELERLCKSEGYAHALAYLSAESNYIKIENFDSSEKRVQQHWESVLRSEVELLTGLMVKAELHNSLKTIPWEKIDEHAKRSKELLAELHERLNYDVYSQLFTENALSDPNEGKRVLAEIGLRESFFYSAETAYEFQYKELAAKKHIVNNDWFEKKKGFSVDNMEKVIVAIADTTASNINIMSLLSEDNKEDIFKFLASNDTADMPDANNIKNDCLTSFLISKQKIIDDTQLSNKVVSNVLDAFSIPKIPCNQAFKVHGDFNELVAYPIIKINDNWYLSFQPRYLMRNFYLSPDFWIREDTSGKKETGKSRGEFLEEACAKCIARVFEDANIYRNVSIPGGKGKDKGEIDVLVCYADKAIIIEAKSKRMTLNAIRGSIDDIKKDFEKGINKAYNQAFEAAELLLNEEYKLLDEHGNPLDIRRDFSDIFPMCITSDTYPGLAHQVFLFLEPKEHDIIRPPCITDIFVLDVLCEFLDNPLYFLNYQDKKARYFKNIIPSNELSILGYHLTNSLFIPPEEVMYIEDDFTIEIDKSFGARRAGIPGEKTPEGILTLHKGDIVENMMKQLAAYEVDYTIDFSNLLLDLSEEAISNFNTQCQELIKKVKQDKILHDFTTIFDDIGVTVHASFDTEVEAHKRLLSHCQIRKYKHKKNKWFGIFLDVENDDEPMKLFVASYAEWEKSKAMEEIIDAMPFAKEVKI